MTFIVRILVLYRNNKYIGSINRNNILQTIQNMSTSTALYICFLFKIIDTLSKIETGPRVLFGLFYTDALKLEISSSEIIVIAINFGPNVLIKKKGIVLGHPNKNAFFQLLRCSLIQIYI